MRIRRESGALGKKRFSPVLWTASAAAAAIVALGVNGTLSQFTASITNTHNQVQTAGPDAFGFSESLVTNGGTNVQLCASASAGQDVTCPMSAGAFAINKYGVDGAPPQPIAPGTTMQTTVRLQNTVGLTVPGGLSGNLGLQVGECTNAAAPEQAGRAVGDLCSAVTVTISCATAPTPTDIGPVSLTALSTGSNATPAAPGTYAIATGIAPQNYVDCLFTTVFPSSATGTDLQDVITNQPLTWTWTQA